MTTTTTITRTSTLGEIVTAHPSLARELERRGLDYCCGGSQTVEQACAAAGLDPAAVLEDLAATRSAGPTEHAAAWATMGPAELVDHIEATHHRYLWDELPRLSALMDKVRSVHVDRHPELAAIRDCAEEIRADLEPHLVKEERVLFPIVRELAAATAAPSFHCGSVRNPISVMLMEHDRVGHLLRRLRDLTGGFSVPADGCESYAALFRAFEELEADTHLHVHKENNLLFPAVLELERRFGP